MGKKFLVFNLVSRNLKIKYRRSVFGLLWTLLNPLALAGIYYFVFRVVLQVQIPHYMAFMLSGVMLWSFFAGTILEGMESIVGNFGLVSKVPIPIQVFPWVGAITNLITMLISMPILIGAAILTDVHLGPSIALLPFYALVLFFMSYGFSLILAIGFVYLRDLRHLAGILLQLWFYSSPVLYDEAMIPPKYQRLLVLNPVAHIFTGIHDVLVRGRWPAPVDVAQVLVWLGVVLVLSIIMLRRLAREVVERI